MRTKVRIIKKEEVKEEFEEQRPVKAECHHHWLIESAKGHTSHGVCKLCGASKEFFNSVPQWDSTVVKRRSPFQELPELDIGPDNKPSTS